MGATLLLAGLLFAGAGAAQDYPARPVKLIVPFPAGGATDAIARLAAESLGSQFSQPVVVENRGGAGGVIAAESVARAPADGHTLLIAGQAILFINKPLMGKLPYNPETDFAFIGMLGSFPNVVVAPVDAKAAKTIQELVQAARAAPGGVSYGSNGIGSLSHLSTEMIAKAAGVRFLHVPYQGAAPQMADLLGARIGFSLIATQTVMPLIRSGKLRALAVSTAGRYPGLPEVPTLVESGFPSVDVPVWFAVTAPAQTPPAVIARLRGALGAVMAAPGYAAELAKREATPMPLSLAESEALFARERRFWEEAVRTTGATQ